MFTHIIYKIKDNKFEGIKEILRNKSEYFDALDKTEENIIELSDDLIENDEQYKTFGIFWEFLHGTIHIETLDHVSAEDLTHVMYLINYFNVRLNESEHKYLINLEIEKSEFKESVIYPNVELKKKHQTDYTEEDWKLYEKDPLYTLNNYTNILYDADPKEYDKSISSNKDEIIKRYLDMRKEKINLEQMKNYLQGGINYFIKENYPSLEREYNNHLKFTQNVDKLIKTNDIIISKITLNINIYLRFPGYNNIFIKSENKDFYNHGGFKYKNILTLLNESCCTSYDKYYYGIESISCKHSCLILNVYMTIATDDVQRIHKLHD